MVKRSIRTPTAVTAMTVRIKANGMESLAAMVRVTIINPPSTTNSPWAKLIMPVAL